MLNITETIMACGHAQIQAMHKSTFEITKEHSLSKRGDCIIAVSADKGLRDLSLNFKESLRKENSKLTILIEAGGVRDFVIAHGSPLLILDHPSDVVVRKSRFICNRTLAIKANKAAFELSRELVKKLKNPEIKVKIKLTIRF